MIGIRTLCSYLLGGKEAARRVASHPKSLWIGLAFVFAAGLAREYDAEDLLSEPWHLAIPLVASLLTSWLLYMVLAPGWMGGDLAEERQHTARGYPALLRLYWWTAPLAIVYAMPVERMTDPASATRINLMLLGIVAAWRVLLITRAISCVWNVTYWTIFFPVMLFADAVALGLLFTIPLPTISIMGGVQLSESEQVLSDVAGSVCTLGILTLLIWFLGWALLAGRLSRAGVGRGNRIVVPKEQSPRVSIPLVLLTVLLLVAWIPIMFKTQPEQQRRHAFESALAAGDFDKAMEDIRGVSRDAFPPHWDPPPRPGFDQEEPHPLRVLAPAFEKHAPLWMIELYVDKAHRMLHDSYFAGGQKFVDWIKVASRRIHRAIPSHPDAALVREKHKQFVDAVSGFAEEAEGK